MPYRKKWKGSLNFDWPVVAILKTPDGAEWFLQAGPVENDWRSPKLVHRGLRNGKANFHLNSNNARPRRDTEAEKLEALHPDLHQTIVQNLPNLKIPERVPEGVFQVAPPPFHANDPKSAPITP